MSHPSSATLWHWLRSFGLPNHPKNLREFTRASVVATATLLPQYEHAGHEPADPDNPTRSTDGPVICGYTTDLGIKGFHLRCAQRVAVGTPCQIMLLEGAQAPETLLASPQLSIEASGRVVRITETGLALEFTAIIGKDSFERLRTLLLAHSSEADRIEGELQTTRWSYETQVIVPTAQRTLPPPRKTFIKRTPSASRISDTK
jgi:hypothetical protein